MESGAVRRRVTKLGSFTNSQLDWRLSDCFDRLVGFGVVLQSNGENSDLMVMLVVGDYWVG